MSLIAAATRFVERAPFPDGLSKLGVAALVDRARRSLSRQLGTSEVEFVREMDQFPVATVVRAANQQHYELPADFLRSRSGRRENTPAAFIRVAKKRSLKLRRSPLKQRSSVPTSKTDSEFWSLGAAGARSVYSWRSAFHWRASQPCRTRTRSGASSNAPRPNVAFKTCAS
jgi:hypothetical protein